MQKYKSWGLIAVGLLLVGLLYWIGNHDPKPQESKKQASHTEQTDRTASPVSNQAGSNKDRKPYKPNCSQKDDADLCVQTRMAEAAENQSFYTLLSIIILVFATIAAGLAAGYARGAVKEGKRAADEAEKGAEAAFKAVVTAQDTAKIQLKAYITMNAGNIEHVVETPNRHLFKINLRFINSGQTPAADVAVAINVAIVKKDETPSFLMPLSEEHLMSKAVIGPNVGFFEIEELSIDQVDFTDAHQKRSDIYVWGACIYTDVYGDARRTNFRLVNWKYQIIEKAHGWTLRACKDGNNIE